MKKLLYVFILLFAVTASVLGERKFIQKDGYIYYTGDSETCKVVSIFPSNFYDKYFESSNKCEYVMSSELDDSLILSAKRISSAVFSGERLSEIRNIRPRFIFSINIDMNTGKVENCYICADKTTIDILKREEGDMLFSLWMSSTFPFDKEKIKCYGNSEKAYYICSLPLVPMLK